MSMNTFMITNPITDVILMISVFATSIITTIGGVGGGGLLIPLYMLIGGFTMEIAIPLTIFTILGDTAVRVAFLYNKVHPLHPKRSLIYFTPILLITLFDANSSFIGVILSNISPQLITISTLLLILSITFTKSISKAIHTYIHEKTILDDPEHGLELIMIDGIGEYFKVEDLELHNDDKRIGDTNASKYINTLMICANIGIVSIFSITRNHLEICGYEYWLHATGQFVTIGALSYFTVYYIRNDYNYKKDTNYAFIKGDISWTDETIRRFALIGTCVGFLSTYIGIGGGMLTTPIMIQAGMIPEVVIASSSISTLASSTISSVNYIIAGKLDMTYGGVFCACSAGGSIMGIYASDYILAKYKRQSILIFVVALIIFSSMLLLTINGVNNNMFIDYNFKPFCKSSD